MAKLNIDELEVIARPEAILKRIQQIERADFFGEYCPRLIGYLNFEHAKPFLKDGVTDEQWHQMNNANLREELHRYLDGWWRDKIESGRGISVHRGRAQVVDLLFLAGVEIWKHIGIDKDEGIDGGWYQEDAYNEIADVFGLPHVKGYREV